MVNQELKKSHDIIIPKRVLHDKRLSPSAKLLYGEITAICDGKCECREKISYFSELYQVSNASVSKWILELKNCGYILINEKISDQNVYKLLNKVNSNTGCLFCGYNKSSLDKHHYPIRRKFGGTETILLCPNCHREFHEMADFIRGIFVPNKKDIDVYKNK